uniref:Major facilitator superfamily (MFS) profile domain-containing protein n=1 Tax=Kwoniella dejecticola CBS 10117 TaxID=1296121 RepID=A0A1A6AFR5_9TREE|nr:uncharacterized protein I303_00728 [Kwoniella dejecticola CBS 10117]OBR88910.1 hypothetical protein I303_00728 [Kwoniella dejecticola CBS 10117]
MVSMMLGFKPKNAPVNPDEAAAVIDPTAHVDLHTGAVIEKKSKKERLFIARLDAILLVYLMISQVIKYLDQQNISAAYVSGMKEELELYGNEYNFMTTWFNVGYAIFLIPSQIIITRVRPSLWLPCLESCWGILTISMYKVTSAKQVFILRAFVSTPLHRCTWVAADRQIRSKQYTPTELAFRIGFYHSCQTVGNMLAGALQAAIYNNLDGRHGISGWRWMMIIDGILTLCVAFAGFVLIPDFPTKPNPLSFWLRPKHVAIAVERTKRFKRADNKKFTFASVKKAVTGPLFYCFVILYVASVLAQASYQYFNLYLKSLTNADGSKTWSVAQINAIPIGGGAITIVTIWVVGFLSDRYQNRWVPVVVQACIGIIPGIIMSIWNVSSGISRGGVYFSYFVCFLTLATAPCIWAWLSDLNPFDAEQRAFTLGFAIAFYYACGAWSSPLIWPAKTAPVFKYGWPVQVALWCLVIIMVLTLRYVEVKHIRPKNRRIIEEKEEAARAAQREAELHAADDIDKKDTQVHRITSIRSAETA